MGAQGSTLKSRKKYLISGFPILPLSDPAAHWWRDMYAVKFMYRRPSYLFNHVVFEFNWPVTSVKMASQVQVCVLCNKSVGVLITVGKTGLESLQRSAILRREEDRGLHFHNNLLVHESCRKNNVNKKKISIGLKTQEDPVIENIPKRTRTKWNETGEICIFCEQELCKNPRESTGEVHCVTQPKFVESIKTTCHQRKDDWSRMVLCKINS